MNLHRYGYLINERKILPVIVEQFQIKCDKEDMPYLKDQLDYRFDNSVLFPIFDLYGEPITVSARRFNIKPKYMHTVYEKSKHLFGLNYSYKDILEKDEVFIVEGAFDYLQMYQNGFKNVVCVLGSALTMRQICLLLRFTNNLCCIPDGDQAGEKSKIRVEKLLKGKGVNLRFVTLPDGYDPDTFILKFGPKKFSHLLYDNSLIKEENLI